MGRGIGRFLCWLWVITLCLYGMAWLSDGRLALGSAFLLSGLICVPFDRMERLLRKLGILWWHRIAFALFFVLTTAIAMLVTPVQQYDQICVATYEAGSNSPTDTSCKPIQSGKRSKEAT